MDKKKLVKTLMWQWARSMERKYVSFWVCFFLTDLPAFLEKKMSAFTETMGWHVPGRKSLECSKPKAQITFECNLNRIDFLDVCFDLNEETYIPYRKPYNTPLYIHAQSSHPPIVKKHLPQMIGRRISD